MDTHSLGRSSSWVNLLILRAFMRKDAVSSLHVSFTVLRDSAYYVKRTEGLIFEAQSTVTFPSPNTKHAFHSYSGENTQSS
jgi:hypothetical protein